MAREIPWLAKRNGVHNVFRYVPPTEEEKRANPKAKGRTERKGLRTRDDDVAKARFIEVLKNPNAHFGGPANHAGITVAEALDDYYREHVRAVDDKGRPLVADQVRQENAIYCLKEGLKDRLLTSVDIPTCRAYAAMRRSGQIHGRKQNGDRRKAKDGTVRRELDVLKAAARHELRWKRIKLGEMPTFELPSPNQEGAEAPWFTKAEIALLLETLDKRIALLRMTDDDATAKVEQRFRDWIELTYEWGARRRSVEQLRVDQVFQEQNRVKLQKAGQRLTKKRRPIVPIYGRIVDTVDRLVANAEDGWLFGSVARSSSGYYPRFVALCEALGKTKEGTGMDDKAWPHVLRHSRATHMLMDGENPYKVAKLLGDTLTTVLRVYGHSCVEFLEDAE